GPVPGLPGLDGRAARVAVPEPAGAGPTAGGALGAGGAALVGRGPDGAAARGDARVVPGQPGAGGLGPAAPLRGRAGAGPGPLRPPASDVAGTGRRAVAELRAGPRGTDPLR